MEGTDLGSAKGARPPQMGQVTTWPRIWGQHVQQASAGGGLPGGALLHGTPLRLEREPGSSSKTRSPGLGLSLV